MTKLAVDDIKSHEEEVTESADQFKTLGINNNLKSDAFVIQKYIERPLLLDNRKFDIRLWVLVTHDHRCFLFKEGYIRMSSYVYSLNKHSVNQPLVHLTNNSVQKCKTNSDYGKYEDGNCLSFEDAR